MQLARQLNKLSKLEQEIKLSRLATTWYVFETKALHQKSNWTQSASSRHTNTQNYLSIFCNIEISEKEIKKKQFNLLTDKKEIKYLWLRPRRWSYTENPKTDERAAQVKKHLLKEYRVLTLQNVHNICREKVKSESRPVSISTSATSMDYKSLPGSPVGIFQTKGIWVGCRFSPAGLNLRTNLQALHIAGR